MQYLFVYGTLRQGSGHPMLDWLSRSASWVGPASIRGRLYWIYDYPGAVTSSRQMDRVMGDVYRLLRPAKTLAKLDNYEGCGGQSPRPFEFRRARVNVVLKDGRRVRAWSYLYNLPIRGLAEITSGDFLVHPGD